MLEIAEKKTLGWMVELLMLKGEDISKLSKQQKQSLQKLKSTGINNAVLNALGRTPSKDSLDSGNTKQTDSRSTELYFSTPNGKSLYEITLHTLNEELKIGNVTESEILPYITFRDKIITDIDYHLTNNYESRVIMHTILNFKGREYYMNSLIEVVRDESRYAQLPHILFDRLKKIVDKDDVMRGNFVTDFHKGGF